MTTQRPRYAAEVREEEDRAARTARAERRRSASVSEIARIDVPFWDVFCFSLKVFVAWAIIGTPCAVAYWYAFLR